MTKKIVALGLGLALCMGMAVPALAQDDDSYDPISADDLLRVEGGEGETIGDVAGLGEADLSTVIATIIRAILGFLGVVAVVIILWGGFLWMTSGGQDEKVRNARKLIIMGIVGLAIVLAAYAIASFVINALVSAVA
jgi:hypothetical protein